MYLSKTPQIVKPLARQFLWSVPTRRKELYLTFDDGPIPEVTSWVLGQLKQFNAKATFFCVGENVQRHPALFQQLKQEGHTVGNHTQNHLSGWKTPAFKYYKNVLQADQHINSTLMRPPYGRITHRQSKALASRYRLVMWDVLSADFDASISPQQCLNNVIDNSKPGSIIVFHDSVKAFTNLRYALHKTLEYFAQKDFRFLPLRNSS